MVMILEKSLSAMFRVLTNLTVSQIIAVSFIIVSHETMLIQTITDMSVVVHQMGHSGYLSSLLPPIEPIPWP
jgi:hypothetical protein